MPLKNRPTQPVLEVTLQIRIQRSQLNLRILKKWILPLLASVLAKMAIHYFTHG